MKKFAGLAATAVLSTLALSGCGGSDEDFCDSYESLDSGDAGVSSMETLDELDRLVDNAPGDIEDEVDVLADAADQFQAAVDEAGIELDALDDPEAMSAEDGAAITEALEGVDVDEEEIAEATTSIEEWVGENCTA